MELRSRYWVTRGRQRVRAVLKKCYLCKLIEGLAYPAPISAELPEFRVEGSGRAFKYTAVDFCGPVYVKNMYDKKVERNEQGIHINYDMCYIENAAFGVVS